jgi:predicted O-methyltransferase YrrM
MERFDEDLAAQVDRYIEALFVPNEPVLTANLRDADAAGIPHINVSPNQGKLLYLLARISQARRILEIGTLGGYSTIWLARALPANGKLITLELNPSHAAVAQKNIDRARLSSIVEVRLGNATDNLQQMIAAAEAPFDFIFIDADKPGYVEYLGFALRLSHPGTVVVADNLIRNGLVLADHPSDLNAQGAKAFNQTLAAHPQLESIILPIFREKLDGLSLSIVR